MRVHQPRDTNGAKQTARSMIDIFKTVGYRLCLNNAKPFRERAGNKCFVVLNTQVISLTFSLKIIKKQIRPTNNAILFSLGVYCVDKINERHLLLTFIYSYC